MLHIKETMNSFDNLPAWVDEKWQGIINLLADMLNIPAALIMKTEDQYMEVFKSSNSQNNPYRVGDKEKWAGLYCETVIKSQKHLLIPNALIDKNWDKNPDLKLGMIAYLGYPINFPDNQPFGTLCVLDNKENPFSEKAEKLLFQFKNVIELDLTLIQSFEIKTNNLSKYIKEQQAQLVNKNIELQKAKEKAEESDRLKSVFLSNISHEIRTPMNGILGFANLLKEPKLEVEDQQKCINIIEKSGARMLNIINDIVDISKIEVGQMNVNLKEIDINEQIEYIYSFFKPETESKGLHFSYKKCAQKKGTGVRTDKEKLLAILTNLIKNSIKYCNQGSIEFGYNQKGEYLEFFVKDTGIGIPKTRQNAIFDRFVQADINDRNALEGAGLGLSISKSYAEMLGGKLWVESEEGKGSIFYFTIHHNSDAK